MNHDEYTKSMEDQLEDKYREIDELKDDLSTAEDLLGDKENEIDALRDYLRNAEERIVELGACLERMSTDIGEVL